MKNNAKSIVFFLLLIIAMLFVSSLLINIDNTKKVEYSEIVDLFRDEKVESFTVTNDDQLILMQKGAEEPIKFKLRSVALFREDLGDLILEQHEKGIIKSFHYEEPIEIAWWVSLLPYVIIIVLFIVLWMYVMNQAMGGKGGKINSFGRAKAKLGSNEKNKVLFSDVAGADEEKEELREVVDFLRDPGKFSALGARIPRGVLLVGPPGTGKTLLAKAVAGEANVPFFSISGSDFVEMYVGVGASRVRDLFETAKKNTPSIIFIDEIDAVGRHRGAGLGGGHDEREQTLNQLLVEMDGFGSNDGVIVMAATNRPDILDPALLRPGRFDRQVTVNYPDIRGREEILKVHARNKPLEKDVDLSVIAKGTPGFTGADLANLLNEAALLSARKGKRLIGMEEIEDSIMKVLLGPQKKSRIISEKDKRLTAYHEAGHAVVTHLLETQPPVHQISIIPAGSAGGYTLSLPQEDKEYLSKLEMEERIVVSLGGRAAEKLILTDITSGASSDIRSASELARNMVTRYGMSDKLGPIVYGTGHEEVFLGRDFSNSRNYSEKYAAEIDDEVMAIIEKAYSKAESLLKTHMDKLHKTANFLMKYEVLGEEQFAALMDGDPTEQELLEIAETKKKKSHAENHSAKAAQQAKPEGSSSDDDAEQGGRAEDDSLDQARGQENNPEESKDDRNGPGPEQP